MAFPFSQLTACQSVPASRRAHTQLPKQVRKQGRLSGLCSRYGLPFPRARSKGLKPAMAARKVLFEPLEPRILLSADLPIDAFDAELDNFTDFLDNLDSFGALGETLPLIEQTLGDKIDLGSIIRDTLTADFDAYVATFDNPLTPDITELPTIDSLAAVTDLANALGATNPFYAGDDVLSFDFALSGDVLEEILTLQLDGYDLGDGVGADVTLSASYDLQFTIGYDLTNGLATGDAFFVDFDALTLSADATMTDAGFSLDFGGLIASVAGGSLDMNTQVEIAFDDPDGDGHLSINELTNSLSDGIGSFVDISTSSSLDAVLPVTVELGGISSDDFGTPTIRVQSDDVFGVAPEIIFDISISDTLKGNILETLAAYDAKIESTLGTGNDVLNTEIPLIGETLGSLLGISNLENTLKLEATAAAYFDASVSASVTPSVSGLIGALNDFLALGNAIDFDLDHWNSSGLNFSGGDGQDGDFRGFDFRGANLSGVNFNGANLSGIDFRGANLSGADLTGANLRGANFGGVDLSGVNLSGAFALGVNFAGATIGSGTNFTDLFFNRSTVWKDGSTNSTTSASSGGSGTGRFLGVGGLDLSGVDLSGFDLSGLDLGGIDFTGANFGDANLRDVIFGGATLLNADFSGAFSIGVDFSGLDLTGIDFTGMFHGGGSGSGSGTNWDLFRVVAPGVDLSDLNLSLFDFSGLDLSGVSFSGAILDHVNFSGADLSGINLNDLSLKGVDLSGALNVDLAGVASLFGGSLGSISFGFGGGSGGEESNQSSFFTGLDLRGVDFGGLDLSAFGGSFDFSGANLKDASLQGVDFGGADFSGAFLQGANLTGSILTGVGNLASSFYDSLSVGFSGGINVSPSEPFDPAGFSFSLSGGLDIAGLDSASISFGAILDFNSLFDQRFALSTEALGLEDEGLKFDFFDLGLGLELDGAGNIQFGTAFDLDMDFGIEIGDGGVSPFVNVNTLTAAAGIGVTDLDLNAKFGPISASIVDGYGLMALDADFSSGTPVLSSSLSATLPVEVDFGGFEFTADLAPVISISDLDLFEGPAPDFDLDFEAFKQIGLIGLLNSPEFFIGGIDGILGGIEGLMADGIFGLPLPFIGDVLSANVDFVHDLRIGINTNLESIFAGDITPISLFQTELFDIFNNVPGLQLVDVNGASLDVDGIALGAADLIGLTSGGDFVEFEMHMAGSQQLANVGIDFAKAMPGMSLDIDAALGIDVGYTFDFAFGFNLTDGFYIATDNDGKNELELYIKALLEDEMGDLADLDVMLGFLGLDVSDNGVNWDQLEGFENSSIPGIDGLLGSGIIGSFSVDLVDTGLGANGDDSDGHLSTTELAASGVFGADGFVQAELNAAAIADFEASVTLGPDFPGISTDFYFEQTFSHSFGQGDSAKNFGDAPTIEFNNVSLDLGGFISEFLDPILGEIQKVTEPIQPVIDILTMELPVISQLAGPTTLLDLAKIFGGDKLNTKYIEAVVDIVDLINSIPTGGEGISIGYGSFSLGGGSDAVDVRDGEKGLSTSDTESADSGFSVSDLLGQLGSPTGKGSTGGLSGAELETNQNFIEKLTGIEGLDFPLLTSPSAILGLLTGKTVDLFRYDMPELAVEFNYTKSFPIFPGLNARFGGGVGAVVDLGFGFDTFGIEMLAAPGGNFGDIFEGFYIADDEGDEITLTAEVTAGASLGVGGLVEAGVQGGIFANIGFDLHDIPDETGAYDEKIRISELVQRLSLGPHCIFDTHGDIKAALEAFLWVGLDLGFFGEITVFEADYEIFSATIASFNIVCPPADPPVFAQIDGDGNLRLNMGDFANQRDPNNTGDIDVADDDEEFSIRQFTQMVDGVEGEYVQVSFNGAPDQKPDPTDEAKERRLNRTFAIDGFTNIVIDAGEGNDSIIVGENVTSNLIIHGGSGNDQITLFGSGTSTIYGDDGDDQILGGDGADIIYGGEGNDTIAGFGGADVIYGESGDDKILGGEGDDVIHGGDEAIVLVNNNRNGGDTLLGGAGNDTIFGGDGDDIMRGNEGDDWLDGGADNDRISGQYGDDVILGNTGDDSLSGNEGADVILGDSGNDAIKWTDTVLIDDVWTDGDGQDLFVSGGADDDSFFVTTSSYDETIILSAASPLTSINVTRPDTGEVVTLLRDAAGLGIDLMGGAEALTLQATGIENLVIDAGDGGDTITVNDMIGSGLDYLTLDLGQSSETSLLVVPVYEDPDADVLVPQLVPKIELVHDTNSDGELLYLDPEGNITTVEFPDNPVMTERVATDEFGEQILIEDSTTLVIPAGGNDLNADAVIIHGGQGDNADMDDEFDVMFRDGELDIIRAGVMSMTLRNAQRSESGVALDTLNIVGNGGNDTIDAGSVGTDADENGILYDADLLALTLEGGDGDDRLIGTAYDDVIDGGADDDTVTGNAGVDTFFDAGGFDTLVEERNLDMSLFDDTFVVGQILADDGGEFFLGAITDEQDRPIEDPLFPIPTFDYLQDTGDVYAIGAEVEDLNFIFEAAEISGGDGNNIIVVDDRDDTIYLDGANHLVGDGTTVSDWTGIATLDNQGNSTDTKEVNGVGLGTNEYYIVSLSGDADALVSIEDTGGTSGYDELYIYGSAGEDQLELEGGDGSDVTHARVLLGYKPPLVGHGDPALDVNGDPILDLNDDPVSVGDPVLDEFGDPVEDAEGDPVLYENEYVAPDYRDEISHRQVERVVINTLGGDDLVLSNDNATVTVINLGSGEDTLVVGTVPQIPDPTNPTYEYPEGIPVADLANTTNGNSALMYVFGQDDNDLFEVNHNLANLYLHGGNHDDTFIINTFVVRNDNLEDSSEITNLSNLFGGGGDNRYQYLQNAPVFINGGAGIDTVVINGTPIGDTFIISDTYVAGAGRITYFTEIERLEVNGASGDDQFYVLGTNENFELIVRGGSGDDTVNLGGDHPAVVFDPPAYTYNPPSYDVPIEPEVEYNDYSYDPGRVYGSVSGFVSASYIRDVAENYAERLISRLKSGNEYLIVEDQAIEDFVDGAVDSVRTNYGWGSWWIFNPKTYYSFNAPAIDIMIGKEVPQFETITPDSYTLDPPAFAFKADGVFDISDIRGRLTIDGGDLFEEPGIGDNVIVHHENGEVSDGALKTSTVYVQDRVEALVYEDDGVTVMQVEGDVPVTIDGVAQFDALGNPITEPGLVDKTEIQFERRLDDNGDEITREFLTLTGLGLGTGESLDGTEYVGVEFKNFEDFEIRLGDAANTFTIDATHEGTTRLILADGNDTVHINGISGETTILGGAGDDIFNVASTPHLTDGIGAVLNIEGDAHVAATINTVLGASLDDETLEVIANSDLVYIDEDTDIVMVNVVTLDDVTGQAVTHKEQETNEAGELIFFDDSGQRTTEPTAPDGRDYERSLLDVNDTHPVQLTREVLLGEIIAGTDTVNVYNDADDLGAIGNLTGSTLDGLGMVGLINYADIQLMNIRLGSGSDTFNVRGTTATTNLFTGDDDDTINVTGTAPIGGGSLDLVLGNLNIDAEGGINTLNVDDSGDTDADTNIEISESLIIGMAPGDIFYTATGGTFEADFDAATGTFASHINISAGSGGNTITVSGTRHDDGVVEVTDINTGTGFDTITVTELDPAFLVMHGQTGNDFFDASQTDGGDGGLTIHGDDGNDTILGGLGLDILTGNQDMDWVVGNGGDDRIFGDDATITRDAAYATLSTVSRNDGNGDDDILIGSAGADLIYGGAGDDTIVGGHIVAGGADGDDTIDGGAGVDLIAGDNADIGSTAASSDQRFRSLSGGAIYDAAGNALLSGASHDNPTGDRERLMSLLDHSTDTAADLYGDDLIAGGADDDIIFGGLGNDSIQGDGSIAETVGVLDPSVEADSDGNDYIEGNGGDDLIFGNLGQDNLIGGSSSLFGLTTAAQRVDGSDVIFGGAGTQISANNPGDTDADGHGRDADYILGDNGNIYNLVDVVTGQPLGFTYDPTILPRAFDMLDYTLGGAAGDLGGADVIAGGGGDDVLHGMTGNDIIFGNGQDDDIYGGTGSDRLYGGAGIDGILGDDGKINTSRNGETETLYGVGTASIETILDMGARLGSITVNLTGELQKSVVLSAFEAGGNDTIYGGLGDDFLHGGAGNDAISGAEAQAAFYDAATPVNAEPIVYDPATRILDGYDAANPASLITGFLLNFDASNGIDAIDDGNDRIFGDLGHDWLVGGTGNDHMFGGLGDDVLNADDNHDTNGGLNDVADTGVYSGADIAFGGGGLDVLIGNSTDDRLFDWVGEFNTYVVPFSQKGPPTINRLPAPQVIQFLGDLGAADGADTSLAEPYGELGLAGPGSALFQEQAGAPRDPVGGGGSGGGTTAAVTTTTTTTTMLFDAASGDFTTTTTGDAPGEETSAPTVIVDVIPPDENAIIVDLGATTWETLGVSEFDLDGSMPDIEGDIIILSEQPADVVETVPPVIDWTPPAAVTSGNSGNGNGKGKSGK